MKFFRKFTLVATVLLSIAFIGCSNSSDSNFIPYIPPSTSEWQSISNKADLIGTWVCDFGSTERVTIVINSNYKGDMTDVMSYDLSSKSQSEIDAYMNKLNKSLLDGGHATYDNTTKEITIIFPIGYDRGYGEGASIDTFAAGVQINSTKDKIRTVKNTQAVYTKQ
ncbi:MAG: hypothetical protein J6V90_07520 [Treponema sp.]|nr:hypothetical protein [Treponema sp.]